jgi:hypothetical protein
VRSKTELAEARKPLELDFENRFLYAHNRPFTPDLPVISNLLSYSEKCRIRCDEQGDVDALYEFIAICGEQALRAGWVLNRIKHARWCLSPDLLLKAKHFASKHHCPRGTYLFYADQGPLSEEDAQAFVKKLQDVARNVFYRIGRALANVQGSGSETALSPEDRQEHRQKSNRQAGAKRSHHKTAKRLAEKIKKEAEWLVKRKGMEQKTARREAERVVVGEWRSNTTAKNQNSILAILKEELAGE